MTTYRTYFLAEAIGAVLFASIFAAGLIIWALLPRIPGNREPDKYKNMKLFCEWMFPKIFENREDGDKKEAMTLFGYTVKKWYVIWLYIMMSCIVIFTVTIFWLNFMIETVMYCDPYDDFDCFSNTTLDSEPVNCWEIERNVSVVCKKFSCNISNAVGSATGVFAFSWITATIILWVITKLLENVLKRNKIPRINDNRQQPLPQERQLQLPPFKCCSTITLIILIQIIMILADTALLSGTVVAKYQDKVSYTCLYEVTIFWLVTIFASTVFWCYCFKESDDEDNWCTEPVPGPTKTISLDTFPSASTPSPKTTPVDMFPPGSTPSPKTTPVYMFPPGSTPSPKSTPAQPTPE